jgi:hypothetical protein
MHLSAVADLVAQLGVLAKEIGKGGGGSTEEPSVCMSLLPVALGVAFVGIQRLRRLRSLRGGRPS